jgi:hypothetical protein
VRIKSKDNIYIFPVELTYYPEDKDFYLNIGTDDDSCLRVIYVPKRGLVTIHSIGFSEKCSENVDIKQWEDGTYLMVLVALYVIVMIKENKKFKMKSGITPEIKNIAWLDNTQIILPNGSVNLTDMDVILYGMSRWVKYFGENNIKDNVNFFNTLTNCINGSLKDPRNKRYDFEDFFKRYYQEVFESKTLIHQLNEIYSESTNLKDFFTKSDKFINTFYPEYKKYIFIPLSKIFKDLHITGFTNNYTWNFDVSKFIEEFVSRVDIEFIGNDLQIGGKTKRQQTKKPYKIEKICKDVYMIHDHITGESHYIDVAEPHKYKKRSKHNVETYNFGILQNK